MTHPQSGFPLAIVTGAAHRLGRAIALGLARSGYAIGLHYFQSEGAAAETAREIESLGVPAALLPADLTDEQQIDRMFAAVARLPFRLRVLVNSAGVMQPANLRDMPAEQWDLTLDLNLRAPFLCAQRAARLMVEEGGIIVNVTDAGDQRAWTGFPAYIVSKAGLEALTRLLARTLAPQIRVNAVAPGLILPPPGFPDQNWMRLVERLPLKRSGDPDEVVKAVEFFIQNEYITGQTVAIDGGYQLL